MVDEYSPMRSNPSQLILEQKKYSGRFSSAGSFSRDNENMDISRKIPDSDLDQLNLSESGGKSALLIPNNNGGVLNPTTQSQHEPKVNITQDK